MSKIIQQLVRLKPFVIQIVFLIYLCDVPLCENLRHVLCHMSEHFHINKILPKNMTVFNLCVPYIKLPTCTL